MGIKGKAIVLVYIYILNSGIIDKHRGKLMTSIVKNMRFLTQQSQRHNGLAMISIADDKLKNKGISSRS